MNTLATVVIIGVPVYMMVYALYWLTQFFTIGRIILFLGRLLSASLIIAHHYYPAMIGYIFVGMVIVVMLAMSVQKVDYWVPEKFNFIVAFLLAIGAMAAFYAVDEYMWIVLIICQLVYQVFFNVTVHKHIIDYGSNVRLSSFDYYAKKRAIRQHAHAILSAVMDCSARILMFL